MVCLKITLFSLQILTDNIFFLNNISSCVNIIAGKRLVGIVIFVFYFCLTLTCYCIVVRKICRKHDRLLSNRMLGDYYHQQIKQNFQSTNNPKSLRNKNTDLIQAPQFGLLLSKPTGLETTGGYTVGICE